MQMNKPKELEVSDKVRVTRKLKERQEPLIMKSAMVLRLYSDSYQDVATPQPGAQTMEFPYCFMSCMQMLKKEKSIAALANIDVKLKEVDMIPANLQLLCVRSAISTDVTKAYADIKS